MKSPVIVKINVYGQRTGNNIIFSYPGLQNLYTYVPADATIEEQQKLIISDYTEFMDVMNENGLPAPTEIAPLEVKTCCGGCGSGCKSDKPVHMLVEFVYHTPEE
jgi:hypothetical protein